LNDLLRGLLPSDDPGIVEVGACFCCRENVFISRCLVMDDFSVPAIPALNFFVTVYFEEQHLLNF
jgi:hypothetical protein